MRLEILHDVSVVAPVVDESKLKYRHVNATKWKNVLVNQSLPCGYQFPEDLFCFLEILRGVDAKGFEGHLLVVQNPSPNIGGSSRRNSNFSAFLDPLEQTDGVGEQSGVA